MVWPSYEYIDLDVFHAELAKAQSGKQRENILLSHIQKLGYDTYLFGVAETADRLYFRSSMHEDWEKEYEFEIESKHDATVRHCLTNKEPLLWSTMREAETTGKYSEEEIEVGNRAIEAGYRVGVTIPLRIPWSTHTYGMSFSRYKATDFEGHDKMFANRSNQITAVARLFFTYIDLAEEFRLQFNLTKEEWDTLKVSFLSRKRLELADALGVGVDAIAKRWQRICTKLGVPDQEAARRLAIAMGAITRGHS